ncbi:MAG: TetR family transcriptional regulator [Ramlibacter sp.]|nr:TetR family transcriptional regulator [Ramlibacter sp.]
MRDRILDAAAALFQTQGYGGTTTQRIAEVASVSHGAMHHHFPTKKHLGLAVIRERVSTAVCEAWIDPLAFCDSTRAGVEGIFECISRGLDERGQVLGCPLNNLALELCAADSDFRDEIGHVFAAWRTALAQRLRADCNAGSKRLAGDADALATFIVAAYSGAMALAKADQSSAALRVTARQLKSMLT